MVTARENDTGYNSTYTPCVEVLLNKATFPVLNLIKFSIDLRSQGCDCNDGILKAPNLPITTHQWQLPKGVKEVTTTD